MTLDELLTFIKTEDGRLRDTYHPYPDDEKRVLAYAVKMYEEIGELSSELLASQRLQRPDKLDAHSPETLSGEFADALITLLLLANATGTDIRSALENKIAKINARYEH